MADTVSLFARDAETAEDIGKAEFSFVVLRDLHNAEKSGELDKKIDGNRIGRLHIVGYAKNVRTGKTVSIDKRTAYQVVGNGRNAIASIRTAFRDEVAARSGSPSGALDSDWEYSTETATLEYRDDTPKAKSRREPPSKLFKKVSGKWMRKVAGYTRKDGVKVPSHYRKSSRQEYLRYKNG